MANLYGRNAGSAYNIGFRQAYSDKYSGKNSIATVDFGAQRSSGSGSTGINGATFTNDQIEKFAEVVAQGYAVEAAYGTKLTIAIGTNNSGGTVTLGLGRTWAGVVGNVARYVLNRPTVTKSVAVWGANDLEPFSGSAATPGPAISWASGYVRSTASPYVDFGSADGCPTGTHNNGGCNNGWTQQDEWTVSWGIPRVAVGARTGARGLPEIYFESGAQQWLQIALYGDVHKGGRQSFTGPLDQNGAPINGQTTNNSTQAWDEFDSALAAHVITRQRMPYSTSIGNQP